MRTRTAIRVFLALSLLGYLSWPYLDPRSAKGAGAPSNALVAARPYRLKVPTQIDPQRSYPLVVVLHGLGGSSVAIERHHGLDSLLEEEGFLAAYPEGTRESVRRHFWNVPFRFWNATDACCNFFGSKVDDVAYLDAVIDDVSAHYRVDPKRVFVMGTSNGGYMSYRYACDRAARVAAVISEAGAMWHDATHCKPSDPVAVLEIHGTADTIVPYEGRAQGTPTESWVPSAHQSVRDWVAFDHCQPAPEASAQGPDLVAHAWGSATKTSIEKWSGCRGVELWTLQGAPHTLTTNQPTWGRTLYHWLAAHPKP